MSRTLTVHHKDDDKSSDAPPSPPVARRFNICWLVAGLVLGSCLAYLHFDGFQASELVQKPFRHPDSLDGDCLSGTTKPETLTDNEFAAEMARLKRLVGDDRSARYPKIRLGDGKQDFKDLDCQIERMERLRD